MSKTLLLISLGPVQDFIAQAKRTRDLWMGSHLVSEISKAAAKALADEGAELVFPALIKGDKELERCDDPLQPDGSPVFNVANKIVAVVEGDGESLAKKAREASKTRLLEWGLKVWHKETDLVDPESEAGAKEQLESFLEFQAVWASFEDAEYADIRNQLEAELQARKSLRIFRPWKDQQGGIHKSSLDGARESVLKKAEERGNQDAWKKYRIGKREQLDAIGLLKRAGGEPGQFVPVPTIGLAPWIALAADECHKEMEELKELCAKLRFPKVNRKTQWVERFPFDGQIFLEDRLQPYCEENGVEQGDLKKLITLIQPIRAKLGDPHPFVACLVADGDKMGDRINNLAQGGYQKHQDFSKRLAGFAGEARDIVENKHRGILVYSGGDDVLALINLEDALKCAFELQARFKDLNKGEATLSVGLGMGGVIESLGDLFVFGREAEREAKQDRDALAILVHKRGGSRRVWRGLWPEDPQERISQDIELLRKGYLSSKKIYELGHMLQKLPKPGEEGDGEWAALLQQEAQRILSRTEAGSAVLKDKELFPSLDKESYETRYVELQRWTERLEIALFLEKATPSSKNKEEKKQ